MSTDPESQRKRWWQRWTRDGVLFFTGLGLTVNEGVFRTGPERPSFLILYAGMMGLPAIVRAQESRQSNSDKGEP